ncbi:hypothetical protein P7K49_032571, partial [Saguinus oedipus]
MATWDAAVDTHQLEELRLGSRLGRDYVGTGFGGVQITFGIILKDSSIILPPQRLSVGHIGKSLGRKEEAF